MPKCVCLSKKQISSEKSAMRTQKRKLRPLAGGTEYTKYKIQNTTHKTARVYTFVCVKMEKNYGL